MLTLAPTIEGLTDWRPIARGGLAVGVALSALAAAALAGYVIICRRRGM